MSSSQVPILDAGRRARHYWFADGIPTVVGGLGCLAVAFAFLYQPRSGGALYAISVAAMLAGMGLYFVVIVWGKEIVEWLKTQITYPRTGYVRPPYPPEDRTTLTVLGLSSHTAAPLPPQDESRVPSDWKRTMVTLTAMLLLGGILFFKNPWFFTAAGVFIAAVVWAERKKYRSSPILLAGFPLLGLCITIFAASRVTGMGGLFYFVAGGGLLLVLDGSVALIRYIIHNPAAKAPVA